MEPVIFTQANRCLTAPVSNPDVKPLYVYTDGLQCISVWQLTDDEIETLVKSKKLYISVYSGETQPPIMAMVDSPFTNNLSETLLIIAGVDGITVNGKQIFSQEQVDNKSYLDSWGTKSVLSTWVARKILTIAVGHGTIPDALDTAFRELFLDSKKQGEPFQLMINIRKFIEDGISGKTGNQSTYLVMSL